MKLPKSFLKGEALRLKLYRELGLYPNEDPKWIEDTDELLALNDFGVEREEAEI